ncbi:MAG TPA: hypothetical protein VE959_01610 [Bryobacteraceae bacterium]|nr:hypothetical protein [Bryobacteraceae bacterium]
MRIFYIQPDKKLMEASFDPRKGSAGVPHVLFHTRIIASNRVLFQYDVSPDGRFLINSFPSSDTAKLTWPTFATHFGLAPKPAILHPANLRLAFLPFPIKIGMIVLYFPYGTRTPADARGGEHPHHP